MQVAVTKRRKTCASGSDWLKKWHEVFFFLSQSLSVVCKTKANANYFRHSSENRSIAAVIIIGILKKLGNDILDHFSHVQITLKLKEN